MIQPKILASTLLLTNSIVLVLFLCGCAGVTPVVPTGPDTYMVASQGVIGNGSGATQKVAAFQAADSYCKSRGEQMLAIHSQESDPLYGRAPSGQVEFRCLKAGDPALKSATQPATTNK